MSCWIFICCCSSESMSFCHAATFVTSSVGTGAVVFAVPLVADLLVIDPPVVAGLLVIDPLVVAGLLVIDPLAGAAGAALAACC